MQDSGQETSRSPKTHYTDTGSIAPPKEYLDAFNPETRRELNREFLAGYLSDTVAQLQHRIGAQGIFPFEHQVWVTDESARHHMDPETFQQVQEDARKAMLHQLDVFKNAQVAWKSGDMDTVREIRPYMENDIHMQQDVIRKLSLKAEKIEDPKFDRLIAQLHKEREAYDSLAEGHRFAREVIQESMEEHRAQLRKTTKFGARVDIQMRVNNLLPLQRLAVDFDHIVPPSAPHNNSNGH